MSSLTAHPAENGRLPGVPRDVILRLSVNQYHRMIDKGILTDEDPVELLEGWLVQDMPKKPAHRLATRRLRKTLDRIAGDEWYVDCQEPVTLEDSEPEPDISVVRGDDEDFRERHPSTGDIGMLVEVADTTIKRDQGVKKRVHARARIPIYWIVNLVDRRIEVYTDPTGPAKRPTYRVRTDYSPGEQVPVVLDGKKVASVDVRRILGE